MRYDSIAAKDEKSLHATDIEEPVYANIEGFDGKPTEENLKNGSSVSSNEDGRVEDFYETITEISDADPYISLTLRLLLL
ncbi:hypothetical protein CK203_042652 [Vitis vinifera]|uniref:Uncharacterized protein n=1 Tax=Vitis vinifera TaxID=29760 RepID=A0A438DKT4_VITVI|nr:hypothetical protein CK203_079614 [Vitis vinifera]RVW92419.1 hypothetical protein CK203_042652 [Vitis vinifera]